VTKNLKNPASAGFFFGTKALIFIKKRSKIAAKTVFLIISHRNDQILSFFHLWTKQ